MPDALVNHGYIGAAAFSPDSYLKAYRLMLLARILDEKFAALYRMGKIHGGVFLGKGQEALSASLGLALQKGDFFAPLIRDTAGRLAFEEPLIESVRTYLGSALGPMRGRDGNVHRGRPLAGVFAMVSHLGSMISVVNGALLAQRLKGVTGAVGATCIGDGGTSTGSFHEALNQAAVEKLPLVIVVANNRYAYSTPNERQFACKSLADRAVGYGVASATLDGTDLEQCLKVLSEAVNRARSGGGPQLIVADLLRLCGHGEHDDAGYVDSQLKKSPTGRDCITAAESCILDRQMANPSDLRQWRKEAVQAVEEAVAKVQREPGPDPYAEDWQALASGHLSEGITQ